MWGELLAGVGHVMTTVVLPAAATAATGYAAVLVRKQAAKAGLEITAAQEAAGKRLVLDVVKRVEERGRRAPVTGPDKQRLAIDEVRQLLASKGAVVTDQQAASLIDTVLGDMRAEHALVDAPPDFSLDPPLP